MTRLKKPTNDLDRTRAPEIDPILLAASVLTLERSSCATLVKVTPTGAHLRGCGDLRVGEHLWLKVGILDALASVTSRDEDFCSIVFDASLSEADLRHFKAEARNLLVMRMSPEERLAAMEWIGGFAG